MSTALDRALTLTRRGVAQPSRQSLAVKRALLACGIGSPVVYVAANVVGALRGGGYSSVNQTVSELTAIDAPSRPVALPLFVASDVLSLAFGAGVVASAGRNRPLGVAGGLLVGVGVANMISPFTRCIPVRCSPRAEGQGPTGHTWPSCLRPRFRLQGPWGSGRPRLASGSGASPSRRW